VAASIFAKSAPYVLSLGQMHWFVDAGTLAEYIDQKTDEAKQTWEKMNN